MGSAGGSRWDCRKTNHSLHPRLCVVWKRNLIPLHHYARLLRYFGTACICFSSSIIISPSTYPYHIPISHHAFLGLAVPSLTSPSSPSSSSIFSGFGVRLSFLRFGLLLRAVLILLAESSGASSLIPSQSPSPSSVSTSHLPSMPTPFVEAGVPILTSTSAALAPLRRCAAAAKPALRSRSVCRIVSALRWSASKASSNASMPL
jgi:hypothetical protein